LILDGIALGLVVVGASGESGEVAVLGVGTYLLGPPIAHAAHGNGGRAWGSFGLRLGMPVGGALVGAGNKDSVEGLLAGFTLGYLGAVVIDAAALAWERPPAATSVASRALISPQVQVSQRAVSAGLSGAF
jgi:hypothetical protein